MSEQMQEMLDRMAVMQAELDSLKPRTKNLPQVEPFPWNSNSKVSSTRRKVPKRLGLALLGGAVVAAILTDFSVSEARMAVNPVSGNNRVGVFIAPPYSSIPKGYPDSFMGLVSTDGIALNLPDLPTDVGQYNTGILGYSGKDYSNGIVGLVSDLKSSGVYGYATNTGSFALRGNAFNTGSYGVYGYASGTDSYAGYFAGNVNATNNFSQLPPTQKADPSK